MNLKGKYIKCVSYKFGNFTKNKLYPINSRFIFASTKEHCNFEITDDEGDTISVCSLLSKNNKSFIIYDKEVDGE